MSSNDKDMFTWMVNHVIQELMDLDMEPKPVTFWWTSTYKADGGKTLQVGGKGKVGRCRSLRSSIGSDIVSQEWEGRNKLGIF